MKTRKVDVAIITVKQPELLATKVTFDIDLTKAEDTYVNGLRYWETMIQDSSGRAMDVVVSMIGESGNVSAAAACDRLFNTYEIGLCIMVGMAAGLKEKVQLGDVVLTESILDYENARLTQEGAKKRPRQYSLEGQLSRDTEYFNPNLYSWYKRLYKAYEKLRRVPNEQVPSLDETWNPRLVPGIILSGEKLIEDGSMDGMREQFHDRIRAVEMEGAGFARMCKEHGIPWLVFRGIADFGETDRDKLWQSTSSLSAAMVARVFIESGYKRPTMA